MYELAFCYPFNSRYFWDGRKTPLNKHWLCIELLNINDFYSHDFDPPYSNYCHSENISNSSIVRFPQLVEIYYIDNTMLCVIKTFWIKIFQRKYKNYYNKKMKYYKNVKNIISRSVYGKWV